MMKNVTYLILALCFLAVSCNKEEASVENYITFFPYVQSVESASTKAVVPDESYIKKERLSVVVNDIAASPVFNNATIPYSDNGFWISDKNWDPSIEYSFYGYIASVGEGTDANVTVSNKGYAVTLVQPTVYAHDENAWSDFLLSYIVKPDPKYTPIVGLQFERVTSAIEIYISKAREDKVTLSEVSISDVTNQMTYSLMSHANEDRTQTGYRNVWSQKAGDGKVTYSRSESIELSRFMAGDDRFDQKFLIMSILTVPQKIAGRLSLSYSVVENGVLSPYTAEYDLSTLPVTELMLGHRLRYYIKIDTSVDVQAVVVPWKEVDLVEGTFLPR